VSAGFSLVEIRGEENPSNRDTERYFGSVHWYDLFVRNLEASITGSWVRAELNGEETYTVDYAGGSEEVTKSYEREEDAFVVTGEVGYRFSRALRASVGSAYGDYDFDSNLDLDQAYSDEFLAADRGYLVSGLGGRLITRTYFVEAWWKLRERLSARWLLEWDHSRISVNTETDDYVRLLSSVTYSF